MCVRWRFGCVIAKLRPYLLCVRCRMCLGRVCLCRKLRSRFAPRLNNEFKRQTSVVGRMCLCGSLVGIPVPIAQLNASTRPVLAGQLLPGRRMGKKCDRFRCSCLFDVTLPACMLFPGFSIQASFRFAHIHSKDTGEPKGAGGEAKGGEGHATGTCVFFVACIVIFGFVRCDSNRRVAGRIGVQTGN